MPVLAVVDVVGTIAGCVPVAAARVGAEMRRLLPAPPADPVPDLVELFGNDSRPARAGRPWVVANMIASIDGEIAVEGRSGPLGGPADKAAFMALRSVCDVIVVGAGTAAAERYGPVRLADEVQDRRRRRGQAPLPRLAIVSASARIDRSLPLFDGPTPIVLTTTDAPRDRVEALAAVADVHQHGTGTVDLAAAFAQLYTDGARVVLTEGGPTLLGHIAGAGLLDELALTIAPLLAGGSGPSIVADLAPGVRPFTLERLLEADQFLFARYVGK